MLLGLRSAISILKTLGAIELCSHKKDEVISPYFLRKKPNGKYRFIFNLKGLNSYMVAPHFKLGLQVCIEIAPTKLLYVFLGS